MDVSYVLPIRCEDLGHDHADLLASLEPLARRGVEILVVDNSGEAAFAEHATTFGAFARHLVPRTPTTNGKVGNVLTGVAAAASERVVIADDDVRYDAGSLGEIARRLERADVVVPTNAFEPRPWHARWDTARTLLNRSFWIDYPGTLGVRRSTLLAAGGYDGDVLFENLELLRTIRAWGGTVEDAADVIVARRPPPVRTFLRQRVRQAYDDLAQPPKLIAMASIAPLVGIAVARRRWGTLAGGVLAAIALAEVGRRRRGGPSAFPATAPLWAPAWVAERAACIWIAIARRVLSGGVAYRGTRLRRAATPMRELRRRAEARRQAGGAMRVDGARERAAEWDPSQSGLVRERPHRHRAIVSRRRQSSSPSSSTSVIGPRTRKGPSR